jgi:hypothetical protein
MRLSLQKNAGRWRLGEMQDVHVQLLRLAAEDASMTDCPGSRERLLQPPLRGRDAFENEQFVDDWDELVTPELEVKLAGDVGHFLSDLDAIAAVKSKDPSAPETYRLDVPLEHANAWFSTLNQARLLLDLKYKLHEPADALEEQDSAQPVPADEDPARLLVLMRYELYAWIQEWLVRNVMEGQGPQ